MESRELIRFNMVSQLIGSMTKFANNTITNALGGPSDAGVNFGDVISGWFGGTRKEEKMFDWKARRQWELNRAWEIDAPKRYMEAGINPMVGMAQHSSSSGNFNMNTSGSNNNGSSAISAIGTILGIALRCLI